MFDLLIIIEVQRQYFVHHVVQTRYPNVLPTDAQCGRLVDRVLKLVTAAMALLLLGQIAQLRGMICTGAVKMLSFPRSPVCDVGTLIGNIVKKSEKSIRNVL